MFRKIPDIFVLFGNHQVSENLSLDEMVGLSANYYLVIFLAM
jgi:hypothetical protein